MPWLLLFPLAGVGWWLLGFPPGWGWLVSPFDQSMPMNWGEVIVLGTVVIGAYGALAWWRENL